MERLRHTVRELAKWSNDKIDMAPENEQWLERELVQLYKLYFDIAQEGIAGDKVRDLPMVHFGNIRINLAYNFPSFGHYRVINRELVDINCDPVTTADALDQLANVLADIKVVDLLYQAGRHQEALQHFVFLFDTRIKARLLPLLNYLKDHNGSLARAV